MQGTWVRSLVLEDPTYHTPEQLSPRATTAVAHVPTAHTPQHEKPPQPEPSTATKNSPYLLQTEKAQAAIKTQHSQKKKKKTEFFLNIIEHKVT